jgi:hypothetical protein
MNLPPPRKLLLTLLLAGLAALSPAVHAAVVNINITDTRGDGLTTTNDTLAGPYGNNRTINNWLGANTGTIEIYNISGDAIGIKGQDAFGPAPAYAISSLEFANSSSSKTPTNFALNASIGATLPTLPSGTAYRIGNADDYSLFYDLDSDFQLQGNQTAVSPNFVSGNYLGFRFSAASAPTDYFYGWLGVTWDGTNMNILSGAYETTANTAILAGATAPSSGPSSSVPDSSSTGALGLLLGGVLVRHWRRQRRTA